MVFTISRIKMKSKSKTFIGRLINLKSNHHLVVCYFSKRLVNVVKAHVLLVLDLDELGGSGVRDFGPA